MEAVMELKEKAFLNPEKHLWGSQTKDIRTEVKTIFEYVFVFVVMGL